MKSFKKYLTELHNVNKYYGESLDRILESLGWKMVGAGKYASVWEVPGKSYVVKVWTDDEPYELFLKYIIKNPNKHFPKVYGRMKTIPAFHKRLHKNEFVKMVKLEKLYPLDRSVYEYVETITDHGRKEYRVKKPVMRKIGNKEYPGTEFEWRDMNEVFPQTDSLYDAYFEMSKHIEASPDNHYNNFMQRKDGTVVMIDPFWYDNTYSLANLYRLELASRDALYDEYDDEDPVYFTKPHYKIKEEPKHTPVVDDYSDIPF